MIALALLVFAAGVSNVALQEFGRIADAHRALDKYDLAIEVTFPAGSPLPPVSATVQKKDEEHELRTFGDLTILQTRDWRVAVDSGDHVIVVGRRGDEERVQTPSAAISPDEVFSRWLERGISISGGDVRPDGTHWLIEVPGGKQLHAELVVDPRTRLIRRLAYEIEDRGQLVRVNLLYTWRDASQLRPGDFDISRFIVVDGDAVRPAEGYAGYKILRSDAHR